MYNSALGKSVDAKNETYNLTVAIASEIFIVPVSYFLGVFEEEDAFSLLLGGRLHYSDVFLRGDVVGPLILF